MKKIIKWLFAFIILMSLLYLYCIDPRCNDEKNKSSEYMYNPSRFRTIRTLDSAKASYYKNLIDSNRLIKLIRSLKIIIDISNQIELSNNAELMIYGETTQRIIYDGKFNSELMLKNIPIYNSMINHKNNYINSNRIYIEIIDHAKHRNYLWYSRTLIDFIHCDILYIKLDKYTTFLSKVNSECCYKAEGDK